MALTPNYGLNFFGGDIPGAITDDGSKFSGADRLALDRMLKALATSTKHLRPTSAELEVGLPVATLGTDGGLPGGVTYAYAVSLVDSDGLETAAGPEVTIETPAILEAPGQLGIAEDVGALPAGLYFYAVTGLRDTEESIQGPPTSLTLPLPAGVELTLPAPPAGTDDYQIWRMASNDVGWTRVAQVEAVEDAVYVDDGTVPANVCADDPAQAPPATNAGVSIYSVTVALSVDDAALVVAGDVAAWRLYRTETPSAYPANALVHHVIDLDDPGETGDPELPLVTEWLDEGDDLLSGAPVIASAQMHITPYVLDAAEVLPDVAGYPQYYPIVVDAQLHYLLGAAWVSLTPPAPEPPGFVTSTKFGVD